MAGGPVKVMLPTMIRLTAVAEPGMNAGRVDASAMVALWPLPEAVTTKGLGAMPTLLCVLVLVSAINAEEEQRSVAHQYRQRDPQH